MSKAASDTLEKVSAEFEAEVVADLEAARAETIAKVESVRKETEEAVAKILETGSKQADSVKRQIVGAAELEARNALLKSLERAVNDVFDLATKEISRSSGANYDRAVGRLIQEGIDVIGPRAKVECASKDKKAVSAAVRELAPKAKLTLEEKPIESIGGVVLSTPDGSVRFDNTFEARLERTKPTLRMEVAEILTSGG
jgi:V/A-type H+/Na+-transporting ATPase subunit E